MLCAYLLFVEKWEKFRNATKSEEQIFVLVSCGWSLAMFLPVALIRFPSCFSDPTLTKS